MSDLEKERELFSRWRDQTAAIQESDQEVQEIREPLDEEAEKRWRGRYRTEMGSTRVGWRGVVCLAHSGRRSKPTAHIALAC